MSNILNRQNQDPKPEGSLFKRIAIAIAVASEIAQLIGAGVQIADYINKPPEAQPVEIVQKKTPQMYQPDQLSD